MNKICYTIAIAIVFFTHPLFAQSIPSGSFEPVTSASPCMFSSNASFGTQMGGNANAFSTIRQSTSAFGTFEFFNTSCNDGTPQSGNWFLSMQWSNGMGSGGTPAGADAISLKVTPQMDSGHAYILKFYTKKNTFYPTTTLAVGYSKLDTTFGEYIGVTAEDVSSSTWTLHTYNFTPNVNCSWITVKADTASTIGNYNYIDVDNFSIAPDLTGLANVNSTNGITIYPNPFQNIARIAVDENIAMPYQFAVYDMTGRIIMQKENINDKEITLQRNAMANGIYFIRITDKEQRLFIAKLVAE
jgi:hypothetical protein